MEEQTVALSLPASRILSDVSTTATVEPRGWRLNNDRDVNLRVPENNKQW